MFVDGIELIDAAKRKHANIRKALDVWLQTHADYSKKK